MSRFANPNAIENVDLGGCECPGKPHSSDWVKLRADLSGSEIAVLLGLGRMSQAEAADATADFIVDWNLLDAKGEALPPSPAALYALKGPTANAIGEGIGKVLRRNLKDPNRSGAPSAESSRESASPIQT